MDKEETLIELIEKRFTDMKTAREYVNKKYGVSELEDISEFNISLKSAVDMIEDYATHLINSVSEEEMTNQAKEPRMLDNPPENDGEISYFLGANWFKKTLLDKLNQ